MAAYEKLKEWLDSGVKLYTPYLTKEDVEECVEALEKQIPMKVASDIDRSWGIETVQPVCPSCDCYLPHFAFIGNGERVTYCEHCGQKILWEE